MLESLLVCTHSATGHWQPPSITAAAPRLAAPRLCCKAIVTEVRCYRVRLHKRFNSHGRPAAPPATPRRRRLQTPNGGDGVRVLCMRPAATVHARAKRGRRAGPRIRSFIPPPTVEGTPTVERPPVNQGARRGALGSVTAPPQMRVTAAGSARRARGPRAGAWRGAADLPHACIVGVNVCVARAHVPVRECMRGLGMYTTVGPRGRRRARRGRDGST